MRTYRAIVAALVTLTPAMASAQISVPINTMAFDTSMSAVMNPCTGGRCRGGSRTRITNGGARTAGALPIAPAATGGALSVGQYQPSDALAKAALTGYVQRIRRINPQAADQVAREFGRHDYRPIYQSIAGDSGFRSDSVSDAMAAYMMMAWLIANGASSEPTRTQVAGLRRQFAGRVAANPSALTNRARMGEELKLLVVTLHAGMQSAQREGRSAQYASGVASMIQKQYGLNLRALRLSDNGFVDA